MGRPGITGHVALVTGAGRRHGIGWATALRLAEDGAHVACLDVGRPPSHAPNYGVGSDDELAELVDEIRATGRQALAITADVTDWAQMHAAVARVDDELGPIGLCCAMAGGVGFGNGIAPLLTLTEDEWDWVVDVNLKGTWITARAAAASMITSGAGGRIVTVASSAALPGANGTTGMAAYAAAKAGVIVLTQNLASELGRYKINVNAISPGMVRTQASQPVKDRLESRGRLEGWLSQIPLKRIGEPEEMAAVVSFLCSDDASYVTGDAVNVTGGQALG